MGHLKDTQDTYVNTNGHVFEDLCMQGKLAPPRILSVSTAAGCSPGEALLNGSQGEEAGWGPDHITAKSLTFQSIRVRFVTLSNNY